MIGGWPRVGGGRGRDWAGRWGVVVEGQSTMEISGVMVTLRAREFPTAEVETELSRQATPESWHSIVESLNNPEQAG